VILHKLIGVLQIPDSFRFRFFFAASDLLDLGGIKFDEFRDRFLILLPEDHELGDPLGLKFCGSFRACGLRLLRDRVCTVAGVSPGFADLTRQIERVHDHHFLKRDIRPLISLGDLARDLFQSLPDICGPVSALQDLDLRSNESRI